MSCLWNWRGRLGAFAHPVPADPRRMLSASVYLFLRETITAPRPCERVASVGATSQVSVAKYTNTALARRTRKKI
jgi:hypothetical protein